MTHMLWWQGFAAGFAVCNAVHYFIRRKKGLL
jgi:hypothetical protein